MLDFDPVILGVHDLMVHDYGPGRRVISLHAEVPAEGNILDIHDIVDNLEHKLCEELGCVATIHMDPIESDNPEVLAMKNAVAAIPASTSFAIRSSTYSRPSTRPSRCTIFAWSSARRTPI